MKKRGAFFYILIILALAALVGLVFLLAPGAEPDTPAVVLPSATPSGGGTGEIPDSFDAENTIAVTPATVQAAVATLARADCYSRTLQVRDFWTGGSRDRTVTVWANGSELRLTVSSSGSAQEHVLLKGQEKWLWYSDGSSVFRGSVLPGDADGYQTLLTYEDMLAVPAADILEADFVDFNGMGCIYVRYRSGTLGFESECYIDPATGLLMGERCYDGEHLFYSMDSSVPDLTAPDAAVFAVPGT